MQWIDRQTDIVIANTVLKYIAHRDVKRIPGTYYGAVRRRTLMHVHTSPYVQVHASTYGAVRSVNRA